MRAPRLIEWLQRWLPAPRSVDVAEGARASAGALIGILLTGLVGLAFARHQQGAVWLVAPMGASAVLLFAVPSSPLAQPWSIVGGNLVAGLVGVSAARWIPEPALAAAVAVSAAIALMLALRCLHPPSGAVTLVAVLGGDEVRAAGYAFVASPVLLDSVVLLAVAVLYNPLTGRSYPHQQRAPSRRPAPPGADVAPRRIGFDADDLSRALAGYNQVLDVSLDDLGNLLRQLEAQVYRRRFGILDCGHVMSAPGPTAVFATELATAWATMRAHRLMALPIVDRTGVVIGIVTRGDFLYHADLVDDRGLKARLARFLRRTEGMHSDKPEVVGQIMSTPARTARDTSPIVDLVPLLADGNLHQVPIVDGAGRLVGVVGQADLIAALYETLLTQSEPAEAPWAPAAS